MRAAAVLPNSFDKNKISFEKSKDFATSTNKVIFVKYNQGFFYLQTPISSAPFGVSKVVETTTNASEISIDLVNPSIGGVEGSDKLPDQELLNERVKEFRKVLEILDNHICEYIFAERNTLFPGRDIESVAEVKKFMYTPLIKSGVSKKTGAVYSDKFRAKFPPYINKSGERSFKVFDRLKNEIDWYSESVTSPHEASWSSRGMLVQMVVHCAGLWLVNGKVSCSFKVAQLRYWSPIAGNFGFDTADEDAVKFKESDEKEEEELIDDSKDSLHKSDDNSSLEESD